MKRKNYITNNRKLLVYTEALTILEKKKYAGLCSVICAAQRNVFGKQLFNFNEFIEIYKRRPSIRQITRNYGFWFNNSILAHYIKYGYYRRKWILKAAIKEIEYAINGG